MAYRSTGTEGVAAGTSVGSAQGLGMPAGMAAGDILILQCLSRGAGSTIATPTGWLAHPTQSTLAFTNTHRMSWFYRVAVGGDAIPTVTQTVSSLLLCRISAFSGRDTTTIFDVTPGRDGNVDALTFAAESITPVTDGSDVFWLFSTEDDNSLGSPSQGTLAYASQTTTGADGSIALVYRNDVPPSPTGTTSLTQAANGPDNWCSFTIALRPAAVTPTSPGSALFDGLSFDVDIAFGATWRTPNPTWTRVTEYLHPDFPVVITDGSSSPYSDAETSTAEFALLNGVTTAGRRFDPDYAAGPYFGQLLPNTPVQIWATYDFSDSYLFTGYIQEWPQVYTPGMASEAYVPIRAVDISGIVSQIECPETALALAVLTDRPSMYFPFAENAQEISGPTADRSGNGHDSFYSQLTTVDSFLLGEPGAKAKGVDLTVPAGQISFRLPFNALGDTPTLIRSAEVWMIGDDLTVSDTVGSTFQAQAYSANAVITMSIRGTNSALDAVPNVYVALADAVNTIVAEVEAPISEGNPYHIVGVLSDNLATFTVYLNGSPIASRDVSAATFEGGSYQGVATVVVGQTTEARVAHLASYESELSAARVLEHYAAGATGGTLQTAQDRLEDLATFAGLIAAEKYDGSSMGSNTYMARAEYSGDVMSEMRKVMDTEQGRLVVRGNGVMTAWGRRTRWGPLWAQFVTSQSTFGDLPDGTELPYHGFSSRPASAATLRNSITVGVRGASVIVKDQTSIDAYGPAAESIESGTNSVQAARLLGESRLRRFSTPITRIERLSIDLRDDRWQDDLINAVLFNLIGYRFTAIIRPADGLGADFSQDVTLEGRTRTIGRHSWVEEWTLTPAHPNYAEGPWMIVGDPVYGLVGEGNLVPR